MMKAQLDNSARCTLILTLMLLSAAVPVVAQTPQKVAAGSRANDKVRGEAGKPSSDSTWLERARTLTAEIAEDGKGTSRYQEPILLARVGAAWFHAEPGRGRQWLEKAVETVESQPPDEMAIDRRERLEAARVVLKVVIPLDRKLADRLLKLIPADTLSQVNPDDAQPQERLKGAQDLSEAVQSVVRSDPQRAAELGKLFLAMRGGNEIKMLMGSLRIRGANQMNGLFGSLRMADEQTANQLFLEAVASARTDYDYTLLFTLSELAFPTVSNPAQTPLPDQLRVAVLGAVADGMLRVPQDEAEGTRICQLSPIAARLLGALPPAQMAGVQNVIQSCSARLSPAEDDDLQDELHKLRTSTDFTGAADAEINLRRRCHYKAKAAFKALQEEDDPLRALAIWDKFTAEEREAYPTWLSDREAAATAAINDLYRAHDLSGIESVIARTADELRAKLQLTTAAMLFARADRPLGLSMLTQARRSLEDTQVNDGSVYLMLLTTYAAAAPAEIARVLDLVVTGINRIPARKSDARLWVLPTGYDLRPYQFGPTMLEVDPTLLQGSVQMFESPVQRVCFRLGLLQAALERYQSEAGSRHAVALAKDVPPKKP